MVTPEVCDIVFLSYPPCKCLRYSFVCFFLRENILVLDIFFEALNYEKIEQKKAYEIAGLLGKICVHVHLGLKNVISFLHTFHFHAVVVL